MGRRDWQESRRDRSVLIPENFVQLNWASFPLLFLFFRLSLDCKRTDSDSDRERTSGEPLCGVHRK
jgi:hypothetical protein